MSGLNVVNEPNVMSGHCYFCRDVDAKHSHEIYDHVLCDSCNTKLSGILTNFAADLVKEGFNITSKLIEAILNPKK